MATVTNTLPITGVPLPFFSYGGTAVATTLAAVGVRGSLARTGTGSSVGRTDEAIDRWRGGRGGRVGRRRGRPRQCPPRAGSAAARRERDRRRRRAPPRARR